MLVVSSELPDLADEALVELPGPSVVTDDLELLASTVELIDQILVLLHLLSHLCVRPLLLLGRVL